MRTISKIAALACVSVMALAPAAWAQVDDDFDLQDAIETVTEPGGGPQDPPHGYQGCDESHADLQAIVQGVKDALHPVTGRYRNFAAMSTYGYFPYADAPLMGFSGRQGHWLNPGFIEDGHIMDPKRPESILVDRFNRPIGVMFINDQPSTNDPATWGPDIYVNEDGSSCNAWHYHTEQLADAYWYAYKYAYSDDVATGQWDPPEQTPDLMHVWAYGASTTAYGGADADGKDDNFRHPWNHDAPPVAEMKADMARLGMNGSSDPRSFDSPSPQELAEFHSAPPEKPGPGPRLPGMPPHGEFED